MRRFAAPIAVAALLIAMGVPAASAASRASTDLKADPAGRWIVVLKPGADGPSVAATHGKKLGFSADRTFHRALQGYAAHLNNGQVGRLRQDSTVAEVVPDERITAQAQVTPTGVSRVGATRSTVAIAGDGGGSVDADVAIVDTGVSRLADLHVVGGYSCSTSTTTAWQDGNGHGTHVAGTVGAVDDGSGVVGVAPGVRIWSVRILDTAGNGLLSWYLCGLDWIAAQRDPTDSSRPLFEAVNMSVAKSGRDDANCGLTNDDPLHQAICRLVASGVTVVAAAGNNSSNASLLVPAAYNEVITVSALADSDGKPGGLGGNRCYSWGTYDKDDTFADFSNFGADVDLIAPGKCIWSTVPTGYKYSSGTSMAAPHVTGAVALLKASRPNLTPAEVREALRYLGTSNWKTSTDPDSVHEPLLDVSRIGPRGSFSLTPGTRAYVGPRGGMVRVPVVVHRSTTSFERVWLSATGLPAGAWSDLGSAYGFSGGTSTVAVHLPAGAITAARTITIRGDEHGIRHTTTATIALDSGAPTAKAPTVKLRLGATLGTSSAPVVVSWPAGTDALSGVGSYLIDRQVDGGAWTRVASTTGRSATLSESFGHSYRYRLTAMDRAGNASKPVAGSTSVASAVQESSAAIRWTGRWTRDAYVNASGGATRWSASFAAHANLTFTGRAIAIVAPKGPTRGLASVYVDGTYRAIINLKRSSPQSRGVVYLASFASSGTHRIEFRVDGTRRVDLDAFVILR